MAEVAMLPLVTIAIPTYNRPALLARALSCVCSQNYPNIELLVSDNCSEGEEVARVVDSFKSRLPGLNYIRHVNNIGGIRNFFSLLERANGKYFMWLADDDEISQNYVFALAQILESNPDAASAAGHWVLMRSAASKKRMPTTALPQRSAALRAARFMWNADDAFFYGLHRTDLLRKATFTGYWWPNKNELSNWAFVYLIDMVLRGRVLLSDDKSVQFINHDYTPKAYSAQRKNVKGVFMHVTRRINVHVMYLIKVKRTLGTIFLVPMTVVSLLSMLREFAYLFGVVVSRSAAQLVRRAR
jgi:glycosyltransferase domain-containing protein